MIQSRFKIQQDESKAQRSVVFFFLFEIVLVFYFGGGGGERGCSHSSFVTCLSRKLRHSPPVELKYMNHASLSHCKAAISSLKVNAVAVKWAKSEMMTRNRLSTFDLTIFVLFSKVNTH